MAKSLKYISWQEEAEKHTITPEEYNEFYDTLKPKKEIAAGRGKNTVRVWWKRECWSYMLDSRNKPMIYYCDKNLNYHIYTIAENSGFEAKRILVQKMKENNGKAIQARYGSVDSKYIQAIHDINRCNGPLIGSKYQGNIELSNVYKADVKSAYPYNALTDIPDWHTAQEVKGYVEPTAEWPVVYYLKSHHVAEFGKYDTHRDCWSPLFKEYRNTTTPNYTAFKHEAAIGFETIRDSAEVCIRCKYSKYDWPEFKYFFDRKEEGDASAKSVMNFSIGTLDFVLMDDSKSKVATGRYEYFGHIRAVILARHNHNMIEYYNEMRQRGYTFISIQTDSMMWQGGPLDCVKRTSNIGDFHLEIAAGRLYCHGCGAYWIEDENNCIEKHQSIKGFPANIESYEDFKAFFERTKEFIGVQAKFNKETRKYEEEEIYYGKK